MKTRAALLVLSGVIAAVGGCSADSSDRAFDLATDSFCTWFTADDMNEIVAAAQQQAGTAYDFAAFPPRNLRHRPLEKL